MLVPIAVMIDWISVFESTLLIRFFSELITLPRKGRIAWKVRSRASVAERRLCLTFELRLGELDRENRGKTLTNVLALEVFILLREQPVLARVVVERAGQCRLEAREVGAPLVGVDVVGKREDRLDVGR